MTTPLVPCFFHRDQLSFRPRYEWAFGERIEHPEKTERADRILEALESQSGRYRLVKPSTRPIHEIEALHCRDLLRLYSTAAQLEEGETFYPTVFVQGSNVVVDAGNIRHSGSFCFDSGTPLSRQTWLAASWSAGCALSAAKAVANAGVTMAYALSRPPGHHATRELFGGYCYLNNTGVAADYLSKTGNVAVVDVDVHHGNGTQALFWKRRDVLTISLHGDPTQSFPYFTGFAREVGAGDGEGFNFNVPLPLGTRGPAYLRTLDEQVLPRLRAYRPRYLVVAAGVDAYFRDPVGQLELQTDDFFDIGRRLGSLGLPVCVVQEGGYYTPDIGDNVLALLDGIRAGCYPAG